MMILRMSKILGVTLRPKNQYESLRFADMQVPDNLMQLTNIHTFYDISKNYQPTMMIHGGIGNWSDFSLFSPFRNNEGLQLRK